MQRLRPLVARVLVRAATDAYLSGDRCLPALGNLKRQKFGFLNRSITKPVNPDLTREFPDLTRAAGSKSLYSHPKLARIQTRQPTAAPREAGCKTSAATRRKRQKTSRWQNAAKARAARSADTYKRVAQRATRVPTLTKRLQASRPLSCDADLCRRRRRQNSIPQKCTASLGDGSPSTHSPNAPARTSSR